jgi:hypothetical protein
MNNCLRILSQTEFKEKAMNPTTLIPMPDAIPVHWGWLNFFLMFTFTLHLLCMNAMLGLGIIALFNSFIPTPDAVATNRQISTKLPYTIAFTVNMGVAPLLFIQVLYGPFIYTSSVLMAVYWISIVLIMLLAYYSAYLYDFTFETLGPRRLIFIAVSVILLLVVAFFFCNNMTLMLLPTEWFRYFASPDGTLLNLSDPTLIPRYLHFVASAVAVGGLFLAMVWKIKGNRSNTPCLRNIKQSMRWFNYATLSQFIIGSWFLMRLPENISGLFMGHHAYATMLFIIGIIGTILALILGFKNKVWPCTVAAVITIVVMVLMRDQLRLAYLKPYFHPSMLETAPQYGPFFLFLISLVIGMLVIGFMLKLAFQDKQKVPS